MKKDDSVVNYPNNIETRVALLEMSINNINNSLIDIKSIMEKRFDKIDERFEKVDNDLKEIRKEMKSDFRWILTIITGLGAIMAHGFHWF